MNVLVKYGLYASLLLIVLSLGSLLVLGTGAENFGIGEIIGYSSILLSLVFIYFGLAEYQRKNGSMSFIKNLGIGTGIALFPYQRKDEEEDK